MSGRYRSHLSASSLTSLRWAAKRACKSGGSTSFSLLPPPTINSFRSAISIHNMRGTLISMGFCTRTWLVLSSTDSTCLERQVISRGSGDMLPKIQTLASPRCTCHMPGPARSAVTTISSSAGGACSAPALTAQSPVSKIARRVAAIRMQPSLQVFPLGFRLRHDAQRSPFRILEHGQPFFSAIGVSVHHMRRVDEFDAARFQQFIRSADIADAHIEDGFRSHRALLTQHQSRSVAIEKCEIAESVEMRQPQYIFVPGF